MEKVYLCPYCETLGKTPDTRGKLYVNTVKHLYYCFRCGSSGGTDALPTDLIYRGESMDVDNANLRIYGFDAPLLLHDDSLIASMVKEHLATRHVTPRDIAFYNLRFSVDTNRIWFPVYGLTGNEPLWYAAYYLHGGYWFSPGNKMINHTLFRTFGIPMFSGKKVDKIVVTEGIFDAISVGRILPSVATFGCIPPRARLSVLPFLANNAVVLYDMDAEEEGMLVTLRLKEMMPCTQADQSKLDGDPGDTDVEILMEILEVD